MGKGKPRRPPPGRPPAIPDARNNPPKPVHTKVSVSFERYECGNRYCLSGYEAEQVRSFLDCLRKLTERTWQQLIDGSSKDPARKTGLNPTSYSDDDLRNANIWPDWLGRDIKIVGIRATERRRIFGARIDNVFYVIWFDERHEIVKG